jgi:hypothetical protein
MRDGEEAIPDSNLDFAWQTVNPVWGRSTVPPELQERLTKKGKVFIDVDGNEFEPSREGMWSLLSFYTRDLRLGFLTRQEVYWAQEYCEIANDCIRQELPESFFLALGKVVALVEVSQSRDGNLRRMNRTQFGEQKVTYQEPPKRFGMNMER